jgi:hypothetical protein
LLPPNREPVSQLIDGPKIRGQVTVTDQERQGRIDLLNEQGNAVQEYLAALQAKPIKADRAYSQRRAELDRPGIKSKLFPVPSVGPKC